MWLSTSRERGGGRSSPLLIIGESPHSQAAPAYSLIPRLLCVQSAPVVKPYLAPLQQMKILDFILWLISSYHCRFVMRRNI